MNAGLGRYWKTLQSRFAGFAIKFGVLYALLFLVSTDTLGPTLTASLPVAGLVALQLELLERSTHVRAPLAPLALVSVIAAVGLPWLYVEHPSRLDPTTGMRFILVGVWGTAIPLFYRIVERGRSERFFNSTRDALIATASFAGIALGFSYLVYASAPIDERTVLHYDSCSGAPVHSPYDVYVTVAFDGRPAPTVTFDGAVANLSRPIYYDKLHFIAVPPELTDGQWQAFGRQSTLTNYKEVYSRVISLGWLGTKEETSLDLTMTVTC